jgi:PAS domain S-box-containing protein
MADGRRRVHQTTASAVPAGPEGGHHALIVVEDVTELADRVADHRRARDQAVDELRERQRAEQALRASEERYRSLFEQSPISVWLSTLDGRVLECNAAHARMFGYEGPDDMKGLPVGALYADPGQRTPLIGRLRATGSVSNEAVKMRRRDGTIIEVLLNMRLLAGGGDDTYIQGTLIDVTEQRQMEARLLEAQKLQAVGRLAGGVAHEFNNLMGVVIGYGEMLLSRPRPPEETSRKVAEMVAAARRAASLTAELLRFARHERPSPQDLDLGAVVVETARFMEHLIGEHIRLETEVAEGLPPVHADRAQVEHVLAALALNARDAMPEGGVLRIGVARGEDGAVTLTVSDTGSGMSPEVMARAFEPFFTTKDVGKGSGLGLASVYGIVQQSAGRIEIDSAPGQGTAVVIHLPAR